MSECISCGYGMPSDALFCIKCGMARTVDPTNAATQHIDAAGAPSKDQLLGALRETTLGEYEILTELGRGGMAVVYLAHDLALERKVAISLGSWAIRWWNGSTAKPEPPPSSHTPASSPSMR